MDNGWPDLGNYEYKIVRRIKRKYKLLQRVFGDKREYIMSFEKKPTTEMFERIVAEFKTMDRDVKCESLL